MRKLGATRVLPWRRLECAPDVEAQVDFDTGASPVGPIAQRCLTSALRMVLSHSRKGSSQATERRTTDTLCAVHPASAWVEIHSAAVEVNGGLQGVAAAVVTGAAIEGHDLLAVEPQGLRPREGLVSRLQQGPLLVLGDIVPRSPRRSSAWWKTTPAALPIAAITRPTRSCLRGGVAVASRRRCGRRLHDG